MDARLFGKEIGIKVYHKPFDFTFNNRRFFIGHGDGLGPGDKGFKRMKKVFTHPFFQWCFRWLHPDIGMRIGQYLSVKNKLISGEEDAVFLGESERMACSICPTEIPRGSPGLFCFWSSSHSTRFARGSQRPLHKFGRLDHSLYLCCFRWRNT